MEEKEYKEIDWSVTIKKVENGYVVTPSSTADGHRTTVFEDKDYPDNEARVEQETIREVMWYLLDYFNVQNDKHYNNDAGQFINIQVTGDEE